MKFSKIIDWILAVIYTIVGCLFSVFLIYHMIDGNKPQLPHPDPFSIVTGLIFLIPSALLAKRGIMSIYNLCKKQTGIDSEDTEQPNQKKAGSSLIIGNIFVGGLGILFLFIVLYAYLSHLSWSKYLFETDAKNYVVSAFQKTSKAREFYEENNHFSSSEAIESEKIIFNGMEYEVSFRIENNMIDMVFGAGAFGEESYNITLIPKNEVSGIFWNCEGGSLPWKYRPPGCIKGYQNSERRAQLENSQARRVQLENSQAQISEFISSTKELKYKLFEHHIIGGTSQPEPLSKFADDYNHNNMSKYVEPIIIYATGTSDNDDYNQNRESKYVGPNIYVPDTSENIVIQAKFKSDTEVSEFIRGKTISLSYVRGKSDSGHWQCGLNSIGVTDIEKYYLPDSCR